VNRSELAKVEDLIDRHGVDGLIDAIIDICYEKEMHVRENWQDHRLANSWQKVASILEKVNERISRIAPL